ncbi:MAG: helix-turn-helix domain-containing protein [Campylobacterales bacterium]|nr:helix-turn-helix domain-containing protein [Campylobacterales bacterium]
MEAREKLDKIKVEWGLKTDDELANKLGIPKNTLNTWIRRKNIPEKWELKIGQMNTIVGNGNIHISGKGNSVNTAPQSKSEYRELFALIEEYATPKLIEEFKVKLLKIKEIIDD